MLDIDMEFRRGILFIRLKGELTKKTILKMNDEVTSLIKENGIKNFVFNISELNNIDMKGISSLYYNYELSKNFAGNSYLCGLQSKIVKDKIKKSHLLNYMLELNSELDALSLMTI